MRKLLKEIHDTDILKVFHSEKTPLHAMVRMSEYSLTWLISQLCNNQQGKPLRLLPFQSVIIWMLWNKKFPMILAARGGSKTFLLALYALIRAILCPGSEIIIVGSGLRQSMKVFGYIVKLYNQSPLIQEAIKRYDRSIGVQNSGPRIVMTGPYMKVGLSTITALPIGDGEKIRGQRATQILIDEFASINEAIFETVIRPFAAVHANPEERVYVEDFCSRLKELGADDGLLDKIISIQGYGNQIVLSGTASFEFNHFFKHYQSYRMIIQSNGDPDIIKRAMEIRSRIGGDHFSRMSKDEINILAKGWKNYGILRLPYNEIPKGFLDDEVVANDKATFSAVRFGLEYGCFVYDTKIITYNGIKRICDIQVGDLVLTHKGRFRKVTETIKYDYCGPVVHYQTYGCNIPHVVTSKHPYLIGDDSWLEIGSIKDCVRLSNLKELNNRIDINLKDYVSDFTECEDKIFAKWPSTKLSKQQKQEIIHSNDHKVSLAKKYNVNLCTIYDVKKKRKTPKGAIPYNLPLNFDFGLIIGYYAAEGSVSANGRAVNFSLDGHINKDLDYYVNQLCAAIHNVFGLEAKRYYKKGGSVVDVTINSRIIVDFIKKVCPGNANNKIIDSDILLSNKEFIKGVVIGYWNGDGHISTKTNNTSATSISINLACQIRLLLSYFKIAASINYYNTEGKGIIQGRVVNLSDKYVIYLYGENAARFREIFYNQHINYQRSKYYNNDGHASILHFKEKNERHYHGMVHNLEVEEDNSYSLLNATVHNCEFAADSDGFIKRSIIENATPKDEDSFSIELYGEHGREYVLGLDPAKFNDNFGLVVLKLTPTGTRAVYADAWKGKDTPESVRKIRDILRRFNIVRIAIDQGGGGEAIAETLRDAKHCEEGELPIYPLREQIQDKKMLGVEALFILDVVKWSSAWIALTAPALEGDIHHYKLLFPVHPVIDDLYNQYELRVLHGSRKINDDERAIIYKMVFGKETEDFEIVELGAWDNLQAMVDETCAIERTVTPGGVEKFELPLIANQSDGMDIRRRDRFSSLVLASHAARVYRDINRNQRPAIPGGSPEALLRLGRGRRLKINKRGNVMY